VNTVKSVECGRVLIDYVVNITYCTYSVVNNITLLFFSSAMSVTENPSILVYLNGILGAFSNSNIGVEKC